jgi:hypothetical protein
METALSLTLVVALITSALPVTAHERVDRTAGPISRAITIEAARLAAEPAVVDANQQAGASTNADWSRVRKLEPGMEIMVTANGSQSGKRYVLSADDSGITVLTLTDPALPAAAREVLRDLASRNPAHFTDAQKGGTLLLDKNVRLQSVGVFVGDQKIADFGQIMTRIARTDVAQIKIERAKGRPGTGALLGLAGGIGLGVWAVNNVSCPGESNFSSCMGTRLGLIPLLGALGGAIVGGYAWQHKTEEIIYSVP